MSIANRFNVGVFRFYYAYAEVLNRLLPSIRVDDKTVYVAPRVYKPLEHEQRLADTCTPESRVLDLGCGSGVTTVFAAEIAKEVVASDISPAAIGNARKNCQAHNLANVVLLESDMFEAIEGRFDLIITHPPYFQIEMEGNDAQYATSTSFLDVLFREAKDYLAEGGRLLVQYPDFQRERLQELAERGGLKMVESRPAERKGWKLLLTSLLYLQFGNHSQQYFFEVA